MKSTPKWLLIPPAVALLLILGPMSMSGGDKTTSNQPALVQPSSTQPTTSKPNAGQPVTPNNGADKVNLGSLVPRTPDMWKISSAFIGVLLLGVGGLIVVKRIRGGVVPSGSTSLATLRQTVRLTAKQALHAIEFDNRILLIGETEKGLSLIDRGSLPDAATDESNVLARQQEESDDGAVPRNLQIPRPDNPPRRIPTAPVVTSAVAPSKADAAIAKLNDFRTLLEKAGR